MSESFKETTAMSIQKIIAFLRSRLKKAFDNIRNEQVKKNLLQAVPYWLGSFLTGLAAVAYAKIFAFSEELLHKILHWHSWLIFPIAPAGFILSWWLVKRFAPYAKGSGIPQVMAAVELATPKERYKVKYLLGIKIVLIKIFSSFALVLGGGAVGREGPTIQIAGSVFYVVNRLLPKWWPRISKKNMILTGAAAGLSAAFNTPMGGIVFAVEELAKIHLSYFKTALFTAVIIAGLTAQWLAGSYLYLGYPKTAGVTAEIIFPVIVLAGVCGLLSSRLSKIMLAINGWKKNFSNLKQIIFLSASALFIACLAYFLNWEVLGSGKEIMERLLSSADKSEQWYVPLLRMVGPALSFTSGGSGGIFAPALSAGACFGAFFSNILHYPENSTNVLILAGMVAFLTGITRAPFTSAILVLEMTDRHSLIFYLMLSGMISSLAASLISRNSLYDELKHIYLVELAGKSPKKKIQLQDLGKKQNTKAGLEV